MDDTQFQKRVGKNIHNQRISVGMTMKELGQKIGLSESSISKYESGDIRQLNIKTLKKMAEALSCDSDDLVKWEYGEHDPDDIDAKAKRLAKHNKLYEQLSADNQGKVDEFIRFLISQQKSQSIRKDNDKSN